MVMGLALAMVMVMVIGGLPPTITIRVIEDQVRLFGPA